MKRAYQNNKFCNLETWVSHQPGKQNTVFTSLSFSLLGHKTVIYGFVAFVKLYIKEALIRQLPGTGKAVCESDALALDNSVFLYIIIYFDGCISTQYSGKKRKPLL